MTLSNLLKIGQLKEHTPTVEEVGRLLEVVRRNIADAAVAASISEAEALLVIVESWLKKQRPDLLS